jgi:hypothetical protein
MYPAPSEHTSVLTLNQDKRRWFDSTPGSQRAGQRVTAYAGRMSQDRDLAPQCALTTQRCAHFGCERPATDYRGGMPLCVGHFFKVLQWELTP